MYPDAIDYRNKIIRELKPNNPRKIREGQKQVARYAEILERIFKVKWKTVVDTYEVKPDGSFKYNFGTPK